jgi:hypothetical protein
VRGMDLTMTRIARVIAPGFPRHATPGGFSPGGNRVTHNLSLDTRKSGAKSGDTKSGDTQLIS